MQQKCSMLKSLGINVLSSYGNTVEYTEKQHSVNRD